MGFLLVTLAQTRLRPILERYPSNSAVRVSLRRRPTYTPTVILLLASAWRSPSWPAACGLN